MDCASHSTSIYNLVVAMGLACKLGGSDPEEIKLTVAKSIRHTLLPHTNPAHSVKE